MLEQGRVTRIKGNKAYVEIKKKSECNSCKACVFGKNSSVLVVAVAQIECKIGDWVEVEMPQKTIVSAPIFLYVIPLAFMLLGALIGARVSELMQILLAFVFLLISLLGVYFTDKLYFRKKSKYTAVITEILTGSNCDKATR